MKLNDKMMAKLDDIVKFTGLRLYAVAKAAGVEIDTSELQHITTMLQAHGVWGNLVNYHDNDGKNAYLSICARRSEIYQQDAKKITFADDVEDLLSSVTMCQAGLDMEVELANVKERYSRVYESDIGKDDNDIPALKKWYINGGLSDTARAYVAGRLRYKAHDNWFEWAIWEYRQNEITRGLRANDIAKRYVEENNNVKQLNDWLLVTTPGSTAQTMLLKKIFEIWPVSDHEITEKGGG